MQLPDFIRKFPALDVPFSEDVVRSYAVRSDAGLVVFFDFVKDMVLPPHSHLAQWGTVLSGEIEFTIAGEITMILLLKFLLLSWDIDMMVNYTTSQALIKLESQV